MRALFCASCLAVVLVGCTKAPGGATDAPADTCTKANQTCRYAEGKLGLCTPSGACDGGGACLVCMSLH